MLHLWHLLIFSVHPLVISKMSKYVAILFDLDGTLRASLPEGWEAFTEFAGRVGITLDKAQMAALEREAHRYWGGRQVDEDMARWDKREFWVNYNQYLLNAIGVEHADTCAVQINDLFDEYDPVDVIFADSRVVLKTLRERGYILGLVSNREEDLMPLVEKYGLAEYFHFTLSGGQAGIYKPHAGIFLKALAMAQPFVAELASTQTIGVTSAATVASAAVTNLPEDESELVSASSALEPDQVLYVGDNYYADVEGARGVNMDSVLIDHRNVFVDFNATRVKRLRDVLQFLD